MSGKGKSNSEDNIFFNFESLEESCKSMTVPELKKELGSRNLKLSGRKTFLVIEKTCLEISERNLEQ